MKAAQNEVQQLDEPFQQALEFIKSDNEYKLSKSKMLQLKRFELSDQEVALTIKHNDRQEKMKESNEKSIEQRKISGESQNELNRLQKVFDKNNNEMNKIKKSLVDFETEDGTIRHEIKSLNEQESKLEKQNQQESTKVENFLNVPEEKSKEIVELEEKLKNAENQREIFEENLNKLKQDLLPQTESWRHELTEQTDEFNRFKQNVYGNKKKDFELAENRLELLLSEEERHKQTLNEIKQDFINKQQELQVKQEEFSLLDHQLKQTEQTHREKSDDLRRTEEEHQQTEKRFRLNQAELNNMNSQVQNNQSRDRTLNFLVGQKIKGFHQRLGSLASIDPKFDVAISTAAGGYLDYYVVDDVKTGEIAKNLLKEHKQGTASFICMDKMMRHGQQANRRFDLPQLAPNTFRLFDLIDIKDPIYRNTFYFALRDTLVVENIDDAQKVAFGSQTRYRVVTLKGEIIEQSGTMSGGGGYQAHGKMTLKTSSSTQRNAAAGRQSIAVDPARKEQLEKLVQQVCFPNEKSNIKS